MKKSIEVIAAVSLPSYGIGLNGSIPWSIKKDMERFRTTTSVTLGNLENVVIMGRKTFESLPKHFRPLPNRVNLVLTRNPEKYSDDEEKRLYYVSSLDEAIAWCDARISCIFRIFVIGGSQCINEALCHPRTSKIHLTEIIEPTYECDVFIDYIELMEDWIRTYQSLSTEQHEKYNLFRFVTYNRKECN